MNIDTIVTVATTSIITSGFNTMTTFFVYKFFLRHIDRKDNYGVDKNKQNGIKALPESNR
jgi:hypothetical protein